MLVFAAGYGDDYLQDLNEEELEKAFHTGTSGQCHENSCIAELLDEATAVIHFPSYCESFDTTQQIAVSKWHCPPVFGLEKIGEGWRVRYLKSKSGTMPAAEVPNYIERVMAQRYEQKMHARIAFLCFVAIMLIAGSLLHFYDWVNYAHAQDTVEVSNK